MLHDVLYFLALILELRIANYLRIRYVSHYRGHDMIHIMIQ